VDREAWLAARRIAVEQDYTRDAPTYHDGYDPATPMHRRFVDRLIEETPEGAAVLDAACGTGPYMGSVIAAGRSVFGVDQSAGMLAEAATRHPEIRLGRLGLQELAFDEGFDAVMVVDAMEHVPPEEWPRVLANLHRALTPGGVLYLTVEEVDRAELDAAFAEGRRRGFPVVHGEDVGQDTGGYHFYPDRDQVAAWLARAGFELVEEADEWLDGYGYHHLLVRASSSA
jgi:SAM-dependent methyltransferase